MEVDLALTMVHELMHTIGQSRYTSDPGYIGNCLERKISGTYPHEPYLNGEGIGETGHNMDQLFFGGIKGLLRTYTIPLYLGASTTRPTIASA